MENQGKGTGIQIEHAYEIADVKYPKGEGWKVVWVFDQSSCHKAMAPDALDAAKMNVNQAGSSQLCTIQCVSILASRKE